jgi:hypothetical protein
MYRGELSTTFNHFKIRVCQANGFSTISKQPQLTDKTFAFSRASSTISLKPLF